MIVSKKVSRLILTIFFMTPQFSFLRATLKTTRSHKVPTVFLFHNFCSKMWDLCVWKLQGQFATADIKLGKI